MCAGERISQYLSQRHPRLSVYGPEIARVLHRTRLTARSSTPVSTLESATSEPAEELGGLSSAHAGSQPSSETPDRVQQGVSATTANYSAMQSGSWRAAPPLGFSPHASRLSADLGHSSASAPRESTAAAVQSSSQAHAAGRHSSHPTSNYSFGLGAAAEAAHVRQPRSSFASHAAPAAQPSGMQQVQSGDYSNAFMPHMPNWGTGLPAWLSHPGEMTECCCTEPLPICCAFLCYCSCMSIMHGVKWSTHHMRPCCPAAAQSTCCKLHAAVFLELA